MVVAGVPSLRQIESGRSGSRLYGGSADVWEEF